MYRYGCMSATVSIVVTVYNKAPYLPPVLRSLAAQEGSFSWEYIFVNDGSTDDSVAVIQQMTTGWPNVNILNQPNMGQVAAANAGIQAATGTYVKFLDADDVLHPAATARLWAGLQAYPKASVAYGDYQKISNNIIEKFVPLPPLGKNFIYLADPLPRLFEKYICNPSQMLVRRSALVACGGCDPHPDIADGNQEYSLSLRLAKQGGFVHVPGVITHWPDVAPGRLSEKNHRVLYMLNKTLALFLEQFPETPQFLHQYACRRAAGRAAKWSRRVHHRWRLVDPAFWRYIRSLFPVKDAPRFIDSTTVVFQEKPR